MVKNRITDGLCHYVNRYVNAKNNYMKDYDKNEKSSYLKYWDVNNLYGWATSQKLPTNGFKWIENLSKFNEDFIKSYNKKINARYFPEVDVQYPENLHELHNDFCPK